MLPRKTHSPSEELKGYHDGHLYHRATRRIAEERQDLAVWEDSPSPPEQAEWLTRTARGDQTPQRSHLPNPFVNPTETPSTQTANALGSMMLRSHQRTDNDAIAFSYDDEEDEDVPTHGRLGVMSPGEATAVLRRQGRDASPSRRARRPFPLRVLSEIEIEALMAESRAPGTPSSLSNLTPLAERGDIENLVARLSDQIAAQNAAARAEDLRNRAEALAAESRMAVRRIDPATRPAPPLSRITLASGARTDLEDSLMAAARGSTLLSTTSMLPPPRPSPSGTYARPAPPAVEPDSDSNEGREPNDGNVPSPRGQVFELQPPQHYYSSWNPWTPRVSNQPCPRRLLSPAERAEHRRLTVEGSPGTAEIIRRAPPEELEGGCNASVAVSTRTRTNTPTPMLSRYFMPPTPSPLRTTTSTPPAAAVSFPEPEAVTTVGDGVPPATTTSMRPTTPPPVFTPQTMIIPTNPPSQMTTASMPTTPRNEMRVISMPSTPLNHVKTQISPTPQRTALPTTLLAQIMTTLTSPFPPRMAKPTTPLDQMMITLMSPSTPRTATPTTPLDQTMTILTSPTPQRTAMPTTPLDQTITALTSPSPQSTTTPTIPPPSTVDSSNSTAPPALPAPPPAEADPPDICTITDEDSIMTTASARNTRGTATTPHRPLRRNLRLDSGINRRSDLRSQTKIIGEGRYCLRTRALKIKPKTN